MCAGDQADSSALGTVSESQVLRSDSDSIGLAGIGSQSTHNLHRGRSGFVLAGQRNGSMENTLRSRAMNHKTTPCECVDRWRTREYRRFAALLPECERERFEVWYGAIFAELEALTTDREFEDFMMKQHPQM